MKSKSAAYQGTPDNGPRWMVDDIDVAGVVGWGPDGELQQIPSGDSPKLLDKMDDVGFFSGDRPGNITIAVRR